MDAEKLQQEAIEFVLSLPPEQQEIFTDAIDRLTTVFTEAKTAGTEFSEEDLTNVFMWAFALNLYLMHNSGEQSPTV